MQNKELVEMKEIVTNLTLAQEGYDEFLKTYVVDKMYSIARATATSFRMRKSIEAFLGVAFFFATGSGIFLALSYWYYESVFITIAIILMFVAALEAVFISLALFLMIYHMFLADNLLTALRTKLFFANNSRAELNGLLHQVKLLETTQEGK